MFKDKLNYIPSRFWKVFDSKEYFNLNRDIDNDIKEGDLLSPTHHFIVSGCDDVKNGKRQLKSNAPFFTEEVYLGHNLDLKIAKERDSEFDAFNHFLEWGYKEFLEGKRLAIGYFPINLTPDEEKRLKEIFNKEKYLLVNKDAKKAITDGLYSDAWDHFIKEGIYQVQKGEATLDPDIPPMSEVDYLVNFRDVYEMLKDGKIKSPYKHFLLHGYSEMLEGKRFLFNKSLYHYKEPELTPQIEEEIKDFESKPLISIIMPVYNVDVKWLKLAIESIENQWYDNWEICIVDDASTKEQTVEYIKSLNHEKIKTAILDKNVNISGASNEALKLATGEYIALMDNDDELTPDALYEVVKAINEQDAEFIYSDEDKLELDGTYSDPHFKPDFAPDMFLSQNYLSHLGVIKKSLVDRVGGWTIGLEGSQDYDLYLRVLEHTNKIAHISKVLYHWRKVLGSTAAEFSEKSYAHDAGRKALENAMSRRGIDAVVKDGLTGGTYKVEYKIKGNPLISIIIPFKDKPELLDMCINSVLEKSTYDNYEIIGISNNSTDKKTFKMMEELSQKDSRVKFHEYNKPFNYSAINNYAVNHHAKGEHIIFLNNDIEIITDRWIEELLAFSQRDDVGAVGAKLYYPDDTIQHAGLILAPYTQHSILLAYSRADREDFGYVSRLRCVNNYNAVTAALMMMKRELFSQIGGFDEENLAIAYNDVDLCLRLREENYLNIFTPFCEAYHFESISRGLDDSVKKLERMKREAHILKSKHKELFANSDIYYNENLNKQSVTFEVDNSNTIYYEGFVAKEFSQKILNSVEVRDKGHDSVCIFSHFDKDNIVDDYVLHYLETLSSLFDIIFVSTSEGMQAGEIKKLRPFCRTVIIKENYGYDFGAWKTGLDYLGNSLNEYSNLLLCNDSVYGPFSDLSQIIEQMRKQKYDIWSMSDSYEIEHHLQSYFVLYNKKAFKSEIVEEFWKNFKIYEDKSTLVINSEVVYHNNLLKSSDLKVGSYYPSARLDSFLNISQYYWKDMLKDKFPFLKIELLRDNPLNVNISKWEKLVSKNSKYLVGLMSKHLERIKQ